MNDQSTRDQGATKRANGIPHLNARPRLTQRIGERFSPQSDTPLMGRRALLRGVAGGAALSLALPALDLFTERAHAQASNTSSDPFFGLFFWANGAPWHAEHGGEQAAAGHADLWTPAREGIIEAPSELLSPLARHQVSVISGLTPHTDIPTSPPGQGDGHMRGFMVALTGDRPQPETFNHSSHSLTALRASLDQVVARHPQFYGERTPVFRSLEVGASAARFHGYGHWNAISYNGPNSQNLPIMNPAALYDRLFSAPLDTSKSQRRALTLDAVRGEAQTLRAVLGTPDRARLDAHLEHLYALQSRIESGSEGCEAPSAPADPSDLIGRASVMGELIAAALRCGLTRCFSVQLTAPATTHVFSNLGVPDGMHKTCHDGHWSRVRDITLHQMEAFAAFLDALSAPEPGGGAPLLDQGLIYATTEYGEGWKHSVRELPVLWAGGAGGVARRNVHVRSPEGNLSIAQLSALRALGLPEERFGWNGGETSETFGALFT